MSRPSWPRAGASLAELKAELEALQEDAEAMADIAVAVLPDGRVAVLEPLTYGNVRLHWGPAGRLWYDADSGFDFDSLTAALIGVATWREGGFVGEPQGWHRHGGTGRRRPGGDPAQEYVRP